MASLSVLLMFVIPSWGQTITTTAGTVTSCPGEIQVPLDVTNCNGIGAISLVLFFDNAALTYAGYQNLNSALTTGLLIVHSAGNRVVISWANTTAANIGNATLMKLRFTSNNTGTSSFTWDTQTPGNCEYSDVLGNILPSSYTNGTAVINQSPSVLAQPADQTALVGQTPAFSLSASGAGLGLQWQGSTDGGSTWVDLVNDGTYSNVNGWTLYFPNVQLTLNGTRYRCRVTGDCLPVVYTSAALLTVINPVTTMLPAASFCPGNITVPVTVTNFNGVEAFSLVFSYNPSVLSYTGFQLLNPVLSGGTFVVNAIGGKVYLSWVSTTPTSFGNGTIVQLLFNCTTGYSDLTWDVGTPGNCEYTDMNGNKLTPVFNNGNETIYALPAMGSGPVSTTIAKGQNTSFSVTASGSGLLYQWQVSNNGGANWSDLVNGGYYSGVYGNVLFISDAQFELSGYQYRCRVSGNCTPSVFSGAATLTVLPNIITTCNPVSACPGTIIVPVSVTDFINIGSFSLVLNFNPAILTYTGYQNLNPAIAGGSFVNNSIAGKVFLSWSGTTASTIASGDVLIYLKFTGVTGGSSLNWDLQTPGNCEYSDISGLVIFSTWNNGSATIWQPPAITVQPVNTSTYSGGNAYFSIAATGLNLSYQWQKSTDGGTSWSDLANIAPYSGMFGPTLSILPASTSLNGYMYRCHIAGTCTPDVFSGTAQLTVTPAAITTAPYSVVSSCTGNLYIPLNVTNCNNVGGISLTLLYDTTQLTYDGYQGVNSGLASGMLVVNRNKNRIILSWASATAANIGSGSIITYRFRARPGISTTLTWDTPTPGNCEYSDINGAIITSFYSDANISVVPEPLLIDAGNDITMTIPPAALNGSASGGVPPYTWLWSPSTWLTNPAIPNPLASPHLSTDYLLTVTGNNGCVATDPVTITVTVAPVINLENITLAGSDAYCYDATQTITVAGGGTSFVVQNGGSANMIAGQDIDFLPGVQVLPGGYLHGYITGTGEYCFALPPVLVKAGLSEQASNVHDESLFRIYPNPTTGTFMLELLHDFATTPLYAEVLGMRGEKVAGESFAGAGSHLFTLAGSPAGIYFVHVICGNRSETKKILKY